KIKEKKIHLHYFPTVDSLKKKVNHALLNFTDMTEEILSLFVKYKKLSRTESY
ncbi:MAG: IS630 family transposase, partial [Desulfobacter postgatei]